MTDTNPSETPAAARKTGRRSLLAALGVVGLGSTGLTAGLGSDADAQRRPETAGAIAPRTCCLLSPEQMTGPYYLDLDKIRCTITEDRAGVPLSLELAVINAVTCRPLPGVAVDIWHCDAAGLYSGYTEFDGPDLPPLDKDGHAQPTDDTTFLRGVQTTNTQGKVEFATIYPGWYWGRALHIHLKAIVGATVRPSAVDGGHVSHTGQLYFPEAVNDRIAAQPPYRSNRTPRIRNGADAIYTDRASGAASTLTLTPLQGNGSIRYGLRGRITLGIDPHAVPPPQPLPG